MLEFRFRWAERGTHIHARVFVGDPNRDQFSFCGVVRFRSEEWAEFRRTLENGTKDNDEVKVTFLEDEVAEVIVNRPEGH